jgi:hypothetical protein
MKLDRSPFTIAKFERLSIFAVTATVGGGTTRVDTAEVVGRFGFATKYAEHCRLSKTFCRLQMLFFAAFISRVRVGKGIGAAAGEPGLA